MRKEEEDKDKEGGETGRKRGRRGRGEKRKGEKKL